MSWLRRPTVTADVGDGLGFGGGRWCVDGEFGVDDVGRRLGCALEGAARRLQRGPQCCGHAGRTVAACTDGACAVGGAAPAAVITVLIEVLIQVLIEVLIDVAIGAWMRAGIGGLRLGGPVGRGARCEYRHDSTLTYATVG